MIRPIKVTEENYQRLLGLSKNFDDEANLVIERLLNFYDGKGFQNFTKEIKPPKRDFTKMMYKGRKLAKNRTVQAIVKDYIQEKDCDLSELREIFPKHLQGSIGVFNTVEKVDKKYSYPNYKKKVHFDEVHELRDGNKIRVCNQWGHNFEKFMNHVKDTLGNVIEFESPHL